jgi:hypothetical protein
MPGLSFDLWIPLANVVAFGGGQLHCFLRTAGSPTAVLRRIAP